MIMFALKTYMFNLVFTNDNYYFDKPKKIVQMPLNSMHGSYFPTYRCINDF